MTPITLSPNATVSAWETNTTNADLVVNGVSLTGMKAAAYLFGQALRTINFLGTFVGDRLDGVQLTDGRFEFPPASGQWATLTEVANALHYKYGVDPVIEFAPGLGLRGYSVADINAILVSLNREFAGDFSLALLDGADVLAATKAGYDAAMRGPVSPDYVPYNATTVATLLNSASTAVLAKATDTELRQDLTTGGDLYTDRFGAFYINGVPTEAQDVAVTTRMLVQENLSGQYKVLMDDMAERNNLIAASRVLVDRIDAGATPTALADTLAALNQQYGYDDILYQKLTAGKISGVAFPKVSEVIGYLTDLNANQSGLAGEIINNKNIVNYDIGNLNNEMAGYDAQLGSLVAQLTAATIYRDSLQPGSFNYTQNYNGVSASIAQMQGQYDSIMFIKSQIQGRLDQKNAVLQSLNKQQAALNASSSGLLSVLYAGPPANFAELSARLTTWWQSVTSNRIDTAGITDPLEFIHLLFNAPVCINVRQVNGQWVTQWDDWVKQSGDTINTAQRAYSLAAFKALPAYITSGASFVSLSGLDAAGIADLKALLNTLISNKVRDSELDQAKLQSITAQLQTNIEAMTALIKAFSDLNSGLAQALR